MNYEKVIVIRSVSKDLNEFDVSPTDKIGMPVGTAIIPKAMWEELKLSQRKASDGSKTNLELSDEFDNRLVLALKANDKRQKEVKKNANGTP